MRCLFILSIVSIVLFSSCSSSRKSQNKNSSSSSADLQPDMKRDMYNDETFQLTAISDDESYGYTQENPVKVGGGFSSGPTNERRYLNALTGPNGETISYNRRGSCCPFNTKNSSLGGGLLDIYEITYAGLSDPIVIYINMYDADEIKAVKGFKFRE